MRLYGHAVNAQLDLPVIVQLGFGTSVLIATILLIQFVAFGGALLFGVNTWCLDGRGALWRDSLIDASISREWLAGVKVLRQPRDGGGDLQTLGRNDEVILAGYAAQSPGAFKIVGKPFSEERYGIGLKKDDAELRNLPVTLPVPHVAEAVRADHGAGVRECRARVAM